jgi:alanyl-tRNA synthetase
MKTNELRTLFLEYFEKHQHAHVESASLIPSNDPTLLFTNAGMVPFKNVFLGNEVRPYTRATSSQRCLRAGGKHNDLENVGYTSRHHTFFEMLGNFSFGDYFKKEAIEFAWTFLTKVLKLPESKLWITVFRDDQETEDLWLKTMKVDPARFTRCGEKDNFWTMGDTGPCGPSTEIFYDHGPEVEGGPPGSPNEDGDRYVEIWNLVFMQFNRSDDGSQTSLPKPCVDTGMGLERIAAVMQNVHNNYDIDLFQKLLAALSDIIGCKNLHDKSMRVIVDHIRSAAFLITDGVIPLNEGRGYVLRRIIRRAIRHGFKLGEKNIFFAKLVPALVSVMGDAYPQLKQSEALIQQVIEQEERQFANTLMKGMKMFDQVVSQLSENELAGETVFQLYDTFGFPPDLTADMARERGFTIDYAGFEVAMQKQRQQSQQSGKFSVAYTEQLHVAGESEFLGYDGLVAKANVTGLLYDNKPVSVLKSGEEGAVILDRTPFYAESGGQVGDTGYLFTENGRFHVLDTQKKGAAILHYGKLLKGAIKKEDPVRAEVDQSRYLIMLNHSATHLLHEALRRILGDQVAQKGSLVDAKRLRFDFSYPNGLSLEQIQSIEHMVNQQIRANIQAEKSEMSLEDAKATGAMALFGEKYGDRVRVVRMGDFSTEICGGTHLGSTGEMGLFKIISEVAVAAGVRRIEAVTAEEALRWVSTGEAQLAELGAILKSKRHEMVVKVSQVLENNRQLSKELARTKQALANQQSGSLSDQAIDVNGIQVLAVELPEIDRETLRHMLDRLKSDLTSYAIVLATVEKGAVQLVAGVSKDCLPSFNATELLNTVASRVGGKGGGRPDLAQGGGDDPEQLESALGRVVDWVRERLMLPSSK